MTGLFSFWIFSGRIAGPSAEPAGVRAAKHVSLSRAHPPECTILKGLSAMTDLSLSSVLVRLWTFSEHAAFRFISGIKSLTTLIAFIGIRSLR